MAPNSDIVSEFKVNNSILFTNTSDANADSNLMHDELNTLLLSKSFSLLIEICQVTRNYGIMIMKGCVNRRCRV